MSPTPRFSAFMRKINQGRGPSGDQRKTRITQEVIDQIRPDGSLVVRGYILPSSGVRINYQVGEVVSVAWNKDGVPQLVFGHNWRRSEYPGLAEEEVTTALEIIFSGTIGGETGVFIVNENTVVALDFRDNPIGNVSDVSWGLNQNAILIRYSQSESPFQDTLRALRINRPATGPDTRTLPVKRDPTTGDLETLGESGVPFVKTTDLSEHPVIDNVPLGKSFTIKENFTFRHRASLGVDELFNPSDPPGFVISGAETQEVVNFEQETPMNLDVDETDLPSSAYQVSLLDAYLNESDQIIAIYKVKWRIESLWDQSFEEGEFPAGCGIVTGPNIVNVPLRVGFTPPFEQPSPIGFDVPFASPSSPAVCPNRAFRGFGIICPAPICSSFPIGNGIQHDKVAETQFGTFEEIPYAHLFAHPQEAFEFPDLGDFFDMFVMNRETNSIIGATFTNPVWEYDREMVFYLAAGAERRHFYAAGGFPFPHTDQLVLGLPFIDGTYSLRTGPGSAGSSTGFVGTGRYHREVAEIEDDFQDVEFGSGILDLDLRNTFSPDTIRNFQVTGRDFHDIRDPNPFDEDLTPRTIFLRSAVGTPTVPGNQQPVQDAGASFTLDVIERTRKTPEAEVEFHINRFRPGAFPVVTLGNKVVFEAVRKSDPIGSPDLEQLSVHEWTIGTPGGLVQIFDTREEISLSVVMQSHRTGILADWSDPLVQFFLRSDGAEHLTEGIPIGGQDDFVFSLPNSYSNDRAKDRRIYTLKINDENVAVFEKTGSPAFDIIDAIEGAFVSGTPAYHVVQVTTEEGTS